jgi:serine/threonine-protein kinase
MQTIGPYQILEELGRGAMGVVFRGFDPIIGRPVAIKVLHAEKFSGAVESGELKLRLAREAAAAGKLSHPNIITIYHFSEDSGYHYLVMELVEGESLDSVFSAERMPAGKTALSILIQVAEALDYAHSQGVVHRDVKPANILISSDGRAKITDFGIARIASQTITKTGLTLGTPAYMSPEQILSAKVSGRADQFSLAVIAYQMLGGRKPFDADSSPSLMHQILSVEPLPLHEVNSAITICTSEVISRALAKTPEDRFTSCREFAERLTESLSPPEKHQQERLVNTTTMPAPKTVPAGEHKRSPIWLGAAVGLVALGLAVATWVGLPRPVPVAPLRGTGVAGEGSPVAPAIGSVAVGGRSSGREQVSASPQTNAGSAKEGGAAASLSRSPERNGRNPGAYAPSSPREPRAPAAAKSLDATTTQALQFAGTGSAVIVPSSPSLNLYGPFTIEAWVKADPATRPSFFSFIISKQLNGTGYALLAITRSNKRVFQFEANSLDKRSVAGVSEVTASTWTHVAGVWDSTGTSKIYVNGQLESELEVHLAPVSNDQSLRIGNSIFGDEMRWGGNIAEVRIWNVARSALDINDFMKIALDIPTSGLVGRWGFDEGSGSVAHDSSGHQNDGAISHAIFTPVSDLPLTRMSSNRRASHTDGSSRPVTRK